MGMTGEVAFVLAKKYVQATAVGLGAVKGAPATIQQIADIDGGHRITFGWIGTDGTQQTSTLDVMNGHDGDKGDPGYTPVKGTDYFDGDPGYSPTVTVANIAGGHKVTVTSEDGSTSFNVMDGQPFTYDDFTLEQLEGLKGTDGISPTVTITEATGRHIVSFTDKEGVKSFVVKDGSDLDVDNYYTKDEVNAALAGKAGTDAIPTVPVNVSELNNDENYIKNTVDNLVNYYVKSDTYTKSEVNGLISNIRKLTSQIVDQLPTENIDPNVIYLIKIGDTSAYMQHMYIKGAWAELGSTQIDLSDYYKKTEIDKKLADKADRTELPTVPTMISAFTNDKGYITEFTETDPTVPAWAKAKNKPSYTAAEVHALPDDTEVPVFTNKTVLDGITAKKVTDWDEAVTDKHTHENKAVIDKFTESSDGTVLYNGEQIANGNLWHGDREKFNAVAEKDVDTTYVVTDEEDSIASVLIDDTKISTQSTWSSEKINKENKEVYSTDEVKTNKVWIDGKPIYRKVSTQTITTPEGFCPIDDFDTSLVDSVISIYGSIKQPSGNITPISFYNKANDGAYVYMSKEAKRFLLFAREIGVGDVILVVEYTKTAD